jgi:NAD-dependent DNA ligase
MSVKKEQLIELMDTLSNIMLKQGEPFRARAYQKAQETILSLKENIIISTEQLKNKSNIGPAILEKINEFIQTGTLQIIEREKNNPINILSNVYGIGPKKAKDLVEINGIKTIEELKAKQNEVLNDTQKIGLKYYDDILKRIPRSEIDNYNIIFKKVFELISPKKSNYEIVGSYRRGHQDSGDIDVIITSDNSNIFTDFVDVLIKNQIITEVLSRGSSKCLVIAKIPSSTIYRRVDFLFTSQEEYPFSILYFTGSKVFNTLMRQHAITQGYTMNEHGLYKLNNEGKKMNKIDKIFKEEREIFEYLNIEYKEPQERTDGRTFISTIQPIKEMPIIKIKSTKLINGTIKNKTLKKKDNNNINIVDEFKKNGISTLEQLNENQLSEIIKKANTNYYNSLKEENIILTDNEYDIIKEYTEKKYPTNTVVKEVGALPQEKQKALLPYYMGSMNKIKPDTSSLELWKKKYEGPYILSCKLDGISGLYTTESQEQPIMPKLYTRGDGTTGQDISHLIKYLHNLPNIKNIVIRGEFIISKDIFNLKYSTNFANPRNMVAGIINNKIITNEIANIIKDIQFVAYEVINPELSPLKQMEYLKTINKHNVLYKVETNIHNLTNELLSDTLIEWRNNSIYEIDGLIVTNNKIYERKKEGNPEHSFAFKMVLSEQIAEAKVVDVIWSPSKDGYLKPRVQIEPIQLGGVKIEYATGFNASFIYNNKIGIGAVIEIIRSGDVIPYIRKIIIKAENPKMPNMPFIWNKTKIDIMLENIEEDNIVREKNLTSFFRGIGVEGLSNGNISRIIQAGYDTVPKIIKMSQEDFLKVDGFKDKMSLKIYNGIKEKLQDASLLTLMSASNIFGRGINEKKIELILNEEPNILTMDENKNQKISRITGIKGIANKTAETFTEKIEPFINFMKEINMEDKLYNQEKQNRENQENQENQDTQNNHPLNNKTIIMTGFRDISLHNNLKQIGAKLGTSVSKNTHIVLVKDKDENTEKANMARQLNIPIMTLSEFKMKYNF